MPLKKIEKLGESELAMIQTMAGTGFSLEEIAEVIEVDTSDFILAYKNRESVVYKTHRKGYLLSQLDLRTRIFKDAGHGSSPAQTLAKKIMDDADFKMKQYE